MINLLDIVESTVRCVLGMPRNEKDEVDSMEVSLLHHVRNQSQYVAILVLPWAVVENHVELFPFCIVV
jgi:hypothetical protein